MSRNDADVYVPPGAFSPNWPPSFAASRAPKVNVFSNGPRLDVPIAAAPDTISVPNIALEPDVMTFFQFGIIIL